MDNLIEKIKFLEEQLAEIKKAVIEPREFEELKQLLFSDKWAEAVDPPLICDINSDQDKKDRAEGIIDIIVKENLTNLRFLDFGCGEGYVVDHATKQNPALAIGYDLVKSPKWETWNEKAQFTTDWDIIYEKKPYDVVLIYDVIDHMMESDEDISNKLRNIKSVLSSRGKIYIRCHPWTSRHATHLHSKINKAFMHLIFTDQELELLGYKQENVRNIIHPLKNYYDLFKKAGLSVHAEHITKAAIEPFFIENLTISKRIKNHWKSSIVHELQSGKKFPSQLEIQFIDFTLS